MTQFSEEAISPQKINERYDVFMEVFSEMDKRARYELMCV